MTPTRILTLSELNRLAMLAEAVGEGRRIARLHDGLVQSGVARAFTREGGGFLTPDDDIRDGFVWVSGITESWWPVTELANGIDKGTVSLDWKD